MSYLPPAAALNRTEEARDQVSQTLLNHPGVEHSINFAGFDLQTFTNRTDSAVGFVKLKHWDERESPDLQSQAIVGQLFGQLNAIPDAFSIPIGMPTIMGMSMTGGFEAYLQNRTGSGSEELAKIADELIAKASARPELTSVRTTFSTKIPQYEAIVNHKKRSSKCFRARNSRRCRQLRTLYVNDFSLYGVPLKLICSRSRLPPGHKI
ncbi:hypothetical protein THIOSC15_320010 [uncultured Thiomicrorhabdus sp.]